MKYIILALSINLFSFNYAIAQKKKDILIEGLHCCYSNNETITFNIRNSSLNKFYVLIGLQRKIKNDWITVLRDIQLTDFSKTDHIIILDTNRMKLSWIPMNAPQYGKKEKVKGKFRFAFFYGNIPTELKNVEYGCSFSIE